jgi:hypothetical protein
MTTSSFVLGPRKWVFVLALLAGVQFAQASLAVDYQFNGNGNWSLSGLGSNNSPTGNLQALVPTGSTVEKAFLYSTLTPYGSFTSVTFDGTVLSSGSFTSLGSNPYGLQAYYTDVTSQVAAKVGSGSASVFNFSVLEGSTYSQDGEALAIVYSNPTEKKRTIAFLGGSTNAAGDSFKVNLAVPLPDPTTAGFEALFSLGIGYSYQSNMAQQYSNVSVDGRKLTSSAGGEDDGGPYDGGLITIGGIGDNPANPANPDATPTNPRSDDELYNLALGNGSSPAPFLTTGNTSFTVTTQNPSGDDNIFFAGINITADAGVNQPPPTPFPTGAVPEPSTYGLLGAVALAGLALRRRFKK